MGTRKDAVNHDAESIDPGSEGGIPLAGARPEQKAPAGRGRRETVTLAERAYFVAVGALAGTVGIPAYFAPAQVVSVLPFAVPPLHARLIGAMYLSGLAIMLGSVLARRWEEVRLVPGITAVWTGGLLLVTLLHLETFDFATTQTRIWFAAYVAYPVIGIGILAARRRDGTAVPPGPAPTTAVRRALTGQGALLTLVGLALLLAPGPMSVGWPWPVTTLLAQIYSAPLLAYGVASLLLARVRTWPEGRIVLVGIWLFALLALVASVIHRGLFDVGLPAAWAWFLALGTVTVVSAIALLTAIAARGNR